MARRKANSEGITSAPPEVAAIMAISSKATIEEDEDPLATSFLGLGIGIP